MTEADLETRLSHLSDTNRPFLIEAAFREDELWISACKICDVTDNEAQQLRPYIRRTFQSDGSLRRPGGTDAGVRLNRTQAK